MSTHRPPSPAEHARGRHIENGLVRYLGRLMRGGVIATFGQPDAIFLRDNQLYFVEAKSQSVYVGRSLQYPTGAPFDGHGLPVDQADRYQLIYETTGIRTLLMVWDDTTFWMQYIDALESGQRYDTTGTRTGRRRIYPLDSFEEYPQMAQFARKAS